MALRKHARDRAHFRAAYIELWKNGELRGRVERAVAVLADCKLCPRRCGVDRLKDETSVCRTGRHAIVSSYGPHFGEERCLSGTRGSGTVFFAYCNLRCVFCQNYEISWGGEGRATTAPELAAMFLDLQKRGCHNINLVTPSHVVPQILEALLLAVDAGLHLPLVYNTSGYDSLDTLALLDGVVDIYMPDFKYWDADVATCCSHAADYPEAARAAIKEMHRQVGPLVLDQEGLASRGVLLRHLVMPDGLAGTPHVLRWVAQELGCDTYVNLMSQYHPAGCVDQVHYGKIARSVTRREMEDAFSSATACGLNRIESPCPPMQWQG
jgi:putative pyruvate formate lyase activating enzyme